MARFFIDRPVFSWVIAILIMLLGFLSIRMIAVEQYPELAPPSVTVTAMYPGADAKTLESTVTQVIERQLTGLDNLLYMSSSSSSNGMAQITLTFANGTDPDNAQNQVNNKIQGSLSRLPQSVQKNGVDVSKNNGSFLKVIAFYSDNPKVTKTEIADFIYNNIQIPIGQVEGVGDTTLFGSQYAMRIWLDPNKLNYYKLSTGDVIAAIQAQNAQVSAGQLGSPPVVKGQAINVTITAQSRLTTTDQFQNILILTTKEGANIYLKDIATVEIGAENYNFSSFFNNQTSAGLAISLASGANQVDTSNAVDQKMQELSKAFPSDIKYTYPFDTTPFVKQSIGNVIQTLIEAIILVVIVMFVFLQNMKTTLVPTIVVPVVLLGTCIVLYTIGFTINTLSMFAMVLAIGLLVDDTIVVVENVERIIDEEGISPYEATVKSMDQITGALLGIAVVLSAVFIPMAFYGGAAGGIYRQFSITLVTAMLLSVMMAIVLAPTLCTQFQKRKAKLDQEGKSHKPTLLGKIGRYPPFSWIQFLFDLFFSGFNHAYTVLQKYYLKSVIHVLRHPIIAILSYIVIVGALLFGMNRLPTGFLPEEDQGAFMVMVQLPTGATQENTEKVLTETTDYLLKNPAIEQVFSISGFSFMGSGQNMGMAFVKLNDEASRKDDNQKLEVIINQSQRELSENLINARIIVMNMPAVPALGMMNGVSYVLQDSSGNGHDALVGVYYQLIAEMNRTGKVRAIPTTMPDVPEYKIDIDFETAQALGLSIDAVDSQISTVFGSSYIDDFTYKNNPKKVYMQSDAEYRMLPSDFSQWQFKNSENQMVPFDAFARVKTSYGSPSLQRYNTFSSMQISGTPLGISTGEAMDIMAKVSATLPKGYSFDWTGISYQEQQTGSQKTVLYLISALVIFLSLAALYESWSIPISILFVIPLGIIGTVYATMFRGLSDDVYFIVGLLTTMGLSAKNAILIVEFAKDAMVKENKSLINATLEACRLRLRPILMTSFAFILGVLPLALNTGAGSASQNAVGTAVIGGMITATFLAIFYVPLFFVYVEKLFMKKDKQ